jgi:hypothetical protein
MAVSNMDMQVAGLTDANYGEKSAERLVQHNHNGYRPRDRETRAGMVGPRIPNCAKAAIFPAFSRRAGWRRRRSPP